MRNFEELRRQLLDRLDTGRELEEAEIREAIDNLVLEEGRTCLLSLKEKTELRNALFYSVRGLDVLQELAEDPQVTEIMANGCRNIFFEKGGVIRRWDRGFSSPERLEDVIQQIAGRCNRTVNEQMPVMDARLADGSRVNMVMRPVALDGPVLTIRKFPDRPMTMDRLVSLGTLTREAADFLRELVEAGYTILVGGGTSTGKTTFLNALSAFIPADERIVTIEDNAELQLQGIENLVRLEARPESLQGGREISIRDLIRTALRMRPNRIIIGEVRGAEAGDFLNCLNTGHEGSLGSAHANSIQDMAGRLEMMALMGTRLPAEVIRRQIAAGIQVLIHLERDREGRRKVEEIGEITGVQEGEVQVASLYRRASTGELERTGELQRRRKLERYRDEKQKAEGKNQI